MVEESLAPDARVSEVARRHDVHPNLLHLWRRQARRRRSGGWARMAGTRFVPVAIGRGDDAMAVTGADAWGRGLGIEVVLRNGRVLRLPESMAPMRAALLAAALERR